MLIDNKKKILIGCYSENESINIPNGITTIGECAFHHSKVAEIKLPYSVISIKEFAFEFCTIEKIKLPNSVKLLGDFAFSHCHFLQQVNIPKYIGYNGKGIFADCHSLQTINLPDVIKYIKMGMFSHCFNLENITISNSVTKIYPYAFYACKNLKEIIIPTSVKSIGEACFSGCTSLAEISLNANIVQERLLEGCENLRSVTLGDKVTIINANAFSGTNVTEIALPDSVTELGREAFMGSSIKNVKLSQNLKSIGVSAFEGLDIEEITLPESLEIIGSSAFKDTKLREITIGENVEEIYSYAFENTLLSEIVIPESVIDMGSGVFRGSDNLKKITVPWQEGKTRVMWNPEWNLGVENVDVVYDDEDEPSWGAFELTAREDTNGNITHYAVTGTETSLKSPLDIFIIPSEYKGYPVTELARNWFCGKPGVMEIPCEDLKVVYIPKSITNNYISEASAIEKVIFEEGTTKIPDRAFEDSYRLKEIVLPDTLETIGNLAFSNTELESVRIPANVNMIYNSFYYCDELTEVIISEGDVPLKLRGSFNSCSNLKTINIPDRVTEIGYSAFKDCENLSFDNLIIGGKVKSIGENAFANCTSIKSITLPDTIDVVGTGAFEGWTSEQEIHVPWKEGEQSIQTWSGSWTEGCNATIVYQGN